MSEKRILIYSRNCCHVVENGLFTSQFLSLRLTSHGFSRNTIPLVNSIKRRPWATLWITQLFTQLLLKRLLRWCTRARVIATPVALKATITESEVHANNPSF